MEVLDKNGIRLVESTVIKPGDALVLKFKSGIPEAEVEAIIDAVESILPEGAKALFLGTDVDAVKIENGCHEYWPQHKTWE